MGKLGDGGWVGFGFMGVETQLKGHSRSYWVYNEEEEKKKKS